jgi:hypothetical protein
MPGQYYAKLKPQNGGLIMSMFDELGEFAFNGNVIKSCEVSCHDTKYQQQQT